MKIKTRIAVFLLIFGVLVAADQYTKYLAVRYLAGRPAAPLLEPLIGLRFLENGGAAWGMLQGRRWFLLLMPVVASAVLIVVFFRTLKYRNHFLSLGIVMILAGGVGNWIDRAFRGGLVVDFLEFLFIDFPVFNVADTCVSIGAVLVGIYVLFFDRRGN